jgi:hypothetical protein
MRPFLERAKKQQQSHNVNTNKSTFLSTTLYAAYRNTRCCLKALTQEQWGVAHLAPLGGFQPARPLEQKTGDLKRGGAFVKPCEPPESELKALNISVLLRVPDKQVSAFRWAYDGNGVCVCVCV